MASGGGRFLAALRVLLTADSVQFEQGMDKASAKARAFEREFARSAKTVELTGKKLENVGKTLTAAISLPLAGVGAAAFKLSTDFNRGMANVGSLIPGATARVLELKRAVQDLAVAQGRDTQDLAGGLYQVISAFGDQAADTMKILEINSKAAAGGVAQTLDAINLTSAVTKAYGDTSAKAVEQVSDLALETVRLGQTTFPELAASIGRVTPVAKTLGVTQQELFASFATLTGVTGNASEVSTQLAAILRAMLNPTEDMSAAIRKLGFSGAEAMVQQLGMVGALQKLVGTTDGSVEAVGKLFGRAEALNAVFAVTGSQAGTFANKMGELGRASGATDRAFQAQTQGVNAVGYAWDQFKSKLKVFGQNLGDALGPGLVKALQATEPLLRVVGNLSRAFSELPSGVQTAVVALGGLAIATGPVILGFGRVIQTAGMIAKVSQDLGLLGKVAGAAGAASGGAGSLTGIGSALGALKAAAAPAAVEVGKVATSTGALTAASIIAAGVVGVKLGGALLKHGDTLRGVQDQYRKAAEDIGLLEGAWILLGDAVKGVVDATLGQAQAYLELAGRAGGKVGEWAKQFAPVWAVADQGERSLTDLGKAWDGLAKGASLLGDGIYDLGRSLYDQGESADQAAAKAKDLAAASKTAGYEVKDWDTALLLVHSHLTELPAELARNDAALKEFLQTYQLAKRDFLGLNDVLLKALGPKPAGPAGGPAAGPKLDEDQQKALAKIQAELAKLQAAHRGAYAAGIADIKTSIAERVREAAGVAALTGALMTLQAAQIQAFNQRFVQEQLGTGLAGYQQQVGDIAKAVDLAKQMGQSLSLEQVQTAGEKLDALQAKGAAVPPTLEGIVEAFRRFKESQQQVEELNKALSEHERLVGLLGPDVRKITDGFLDLERAVELRTGGEIGTGILGNLEKLSEGQLEVVVRQLQELQQQARAANVEVPGLADALGEAWRRLQDMRGGPTVVHNVGEATAAAKVKTESWSQAVRDLAAVFEVLGIKADSGIGRVLGGLTAGAAAIEKLKKAGTLGGKEGVGFSLSNIFKTSDGKTTFGSLVGGITGGLQAASAAIGIGKAIVGLFKADPVKKAAKEAGQVVGEQVSRDLAQKILDTSKALGTSIKTAALVNLPAVMAEAAAKGKDPRQFAGQVTQLFDVIKQGGPAAQAAVKALGESFGQVADAALNSGTVGDRSLRQIIRAAREAGQVTKEIKDFITGQVTAAAQGIGAVVGSFAEDKGEGGKLLGGLDLFMGAGENWKAVLGQAEENGRALARRFFGTFQAMANEVGIREAAKAMGEPFERLKEQLSAVLGPEEIEKVLGPIQRMIDLSNNPLFAGASDAVAGLKANLEGLANADLLQASDLKDYGTLAQATVQQLLAGGATSKEALQAVQPLLQSLISASEQYGVTLDENTQSLVDQAQAQGLAFKTDKQQQMVDILASIARKLGADIPENVNRSSTAFGQLGTSGEAAAGRVTTSFDGVPGKLGEAGERAAQSFSEALTGGTEAVVSASEASIGSLVASTTEGWASIGGVAEGVLSGIAEKMAELRRGIVVPISFAQEGGASSIPLPAPDLPHAAQGAYASARAGGHGLIVGEGGGDEIVAPVAQMLDQAFAYSQRGGGVFDLGPLVAVLQRENAALRAEVGRLADRPLAAAIHLDGRELADSHVEQLAAGNSRLEGAVRRAVSGARRG